MERRLLAALALLLALPGCHARGTPAITARARATFDPVDALRQAIAVTPSFDNHVALGLALANAGRHQEALAEMRATLAINPEAPVALNNLCSEYNALNQPAAGLEYCLRAVKNQPEYALARNNLAYARRLLAAQPAREVSDASRVELGLAYYRAGDFPRAIEEWRKIGPASPQYGAAQNNLGSVFIQTRQFKLAHEALRRALAREPQNGLYHNNARWLASEEARR